LTLSDSFQLIQQHYIPNQDGLYSQNQLGSRVVRVRIVLESNKTDLLTRNRLYDKHLSSLKNSNDAEVAKRELEDAIARQSKARCLDISAKLTQLPRELRV
jgi:hypothetical protein